MKSQNHRLFVCLAGLVIASLACGLGTLPLPTPTNTSLPPTPKLEPIATQSSVPTQTSDLAQSPAGYSWRVIPEVSLSVLVPDSWYFKAEQYKDSASGYFVTKENIDADPAGQYSTGMSIYVVPSNDPSVNVAAYAKKSITDTANLGTTTKVISKSESNLGNIISYQLQIEAEFSKLETGNPNRNKTIYYQYAANQDTHTLYLISFESPTQLWDEEWQKGQVITKTVLSNSTLTSAAYPDPGPAPAGIPGAETSQYLKTTAGGFNTVVSEKKATYFITLDVLRDLPPEAYIEVYFENPLYPTQSIMISQPGPQASQLKFESPAITGLKCKNYWIEIYIYSNPDKTNQLGKHVQWIHSNFELDKVQSVQDLTDSRTCST